MQVADAIFASDFNEPLIHQVVIAYLAGGRSGTKAQKTRSDVRGGGIKPWKQKGTGRARAGTIRSPLWRGGGRVFAARPRDYSQKVNRKMYRGAICSILAELVRQDRLLVLDGIDVAEPKTRELIATLRNLALDNVLLVDERFSENLQRAARNAIHIGLREVAELDPVALLAHDKVVITSSALSRLQDSLQ
jgi:large subunit ribosomal protein L4